VARIPYYSLENGEEEKVALVSNKPRLNFALMLAHIKYPILDSLLSFGSSLMIQGDLDPILRQMAVVRTVILCRSDYEVYQHLKVARNIGMSEEKITALFIGSAALVFSDIEKWVLRFAEETVALGKATDETFQAAAAHFTHGQLVELGLVVGYFMALSSFLNNFEIDIETPEAS
jgi:4-carboxymuconolactone decarboxylase